MSEQTQKYYRELKSRNSKMEEVTEKEVLQCLDGPYKDAKAALEYLLDTGAINTPFAMYYTEEMAKAIMAKSAEGSL